MPNTKNKNLKISSQGSYPSQAAQRSSQGSYQSSPTIQNSNQYQVKIKKYVDNERTKLYLYNKFNESVINLMKDFNAKYFCVSIENSFELLFKIILNFEVLSEKEPYKKYITEQDKNNINIINNKIENYLQQQQKQTKRKNLGMVKFGQSSINFIFEFITDKKQKLFVSENFFINQTINKYYIKLLDINEKLITPEITSEQSFLLKTQQRIYELSLLNYLNDCLKKKKKIYYL